MIYSNCNLSVKNGRNAVKSFLERRMFFSDYHSHQCVMMLNKLITVSSSPWIALKPSVETSMGIIAFN